MFEETLSRLGKCLKRHNLPYMIIGGQAVLLYGEPRLTRDIDVTLGVNADHLKKVLEVAQEVSLKPIPEDLSAFVQQTMVLPTLEDSNGIRVDFIFSFSPYETQAIERGRKIIIMGQEVCFASPEDVVIHKNNAEAIKKALDVVVGKIDVTGGKAKPKTVSALSDIDDIAVETGISDLAAHHDHYLYGAPKK